MNYCNIILFYRNKIFFLNNLIYFYFICIKLFSHVRKQKKSSLIIFEFYYGTFLFDVFNIKNILFYCITF